MKVAPFAASPRFAYKPNCAPTIKIHVQIPRPSPLNPKQSSHAAFLLNPSTRSSSTSNISFIKDRSDRTLHERTRRSSYTEIGSVVPLQEAKLDGRLLIEYVQDHEARNFCRPSLLVHSTFIGHLPISVVLSIDSIPTGYFSNKVLQTLVSAPAGGYPNFPA